MEGETVKRPGQAGTNFWTFGRSQPAHGDKTCSFTHMLI